MNRMLGSLWYSCQLYSIWRPDTSDVSYLYKIQDALDENVPYLLLFVLQYRYPYGTHLNFQITCLQIKHRTRTVLYE